VTIGAAEQLLRDFYAAYGRRDLTAMREFLAGKPGLEWDMNPHDPDSRHLTGSEAVEQLEAMFEAFDALTTDIEEVEERGNQLLMVVKHRARGRASGIVTERREVHLWTIEEGFPVRMQEFQTKEEALAS
jgi:ketosteroid isomerase-like protein